MNVTIVCEDCGRDLGTQVVRKEEVTIKVHGCKCKSAGFIEGFESGKRRAKEVFDTKKG